MGINDYIKIGNRIRKFRTEKGYTQKKMAELCAIPYSTYSNYENNNREPSTEQIEKIAGILEITVEELIGHVEKIDEFTLKSIDSYNYHIIRLLEEKDKLSLKQQILDDEQTFDKTNEDSRMKYAVDADFNQSMLQQTFSDLDFIKAAIISSRSEKELSLPYEILFQLRRLNPDGERRLLEEIETLSFNPKYGVPLKPNDWDPFSDI